MSRPLALIRIGASSSRRPIHLEGEVVAEAEAD